MIKKLLKEQKTNLQNIVHNYPHALKVLYFLLIIDFFFVLLHAYSLTLPLTESTKNLRLDMDRGYAEMFQYLKFLSAAILLTILFFKEKIGIYIVWTLFFLFLFSDDAFSWHEAIGAWLRRFFDIQGILGMRGQDIGELAFVGTVGLFFMVSFLSTLLRGAKKAKQVTIDFFLLVGVLVFFGVGMDILHSMLVNIPGSGILTIIEDWGEMLAASLMLWYAVYLYLEQKKLRSHHFKKEKRKSTQRI